MIQPKQWGNWLKVFAFMMIFTLAQIPISQYAFGGPAAAEVLHKTAVEETTEKLIKSVEEETEEQEEQEIKELVTKELVTKELVTKELVTEELVTEEQVTKKQEPNEQVTNVQPANKEASINESADEVIKEENPIQENKIQNGKKPVYLTIDDGPGPVSDEFLDILARYEVEATFFLLEPRVRTYHAEVSRMAKEGHRLGSHGVTHDVKRFYASAESVVSELDKTRAALREVTGLECLLARTPYGSAPHLSQEQDQAAAKAGYKLWDWNVDSRDWYYRDEEYVLKTLEQVQKITAAGAEPVILIHELKSTAKHLPQLIEELLAQGYEFQLLEVNASPVRLR